MTAPVRLDSAEVARGLEVLQQELLALRPSPRQVLVYRLLQWDMAAFAVALVGFTIAASLTNTHGQPSTLTNLAAGLLGFTGLVMFPLFLLNLGLVRKLRRVALVRRRLGLDQLLGAAFKAQRRKARVRNLLTALLVLVGVVFVLAAVAIAIPAVKTLGSPLTALVVALYLALAIPLVALHFLRRGMERLAVVESLHSALSATASDAREGEGSSVAVSPNAYELIANIERAQVIAERDQSIRRSGGGPDTSGYAVQISFAAHQAKSLLPPRERLIVDEQILRLMEGPQRGGVVMDGEGTRRRFLVPDTSTEIVFDVDREERRVRVLDIVPPSPHHPGHTQTGT